MKQCTKCNIVKEFSNFSIRNKAKDKLHNWCKQCIKAYDRLRHQSNPNYRKDITKNSKQTKRSWITELKSTLVCSSCPENHPSCLQFHHLDPTKKENTIANSLRLGWSKEHILSEISKCIVLCANCHFKFHYNEKNQSG